MPPHLMDHQPQPINSAVVLTSDQMNELKEFFAELAERSQQPAKSLTDEQFAELQKLLQPGYELSTLMLADYKAQRLAAQTTTRDVLAAQQAEPVEDWRTADEINRGIPLDAADKDEIIAGRPA